MKSRPVTPAGPPATQAIAAELDRLFRKQLDLMKSESFVGLTPAQRKEYEKIGIRIRELFAELSRTRG
jgi:hypothetical protein